MASYLPMELLLGGLVDLVLLQRPVQKFVLGPELLVAHPGLLVFDHAIHIVLTIGLGSELVRSQPQRSLHAEHQNPKESVHNSSLSVVPIIVVVNPTKR